jgi:hypothetical protein
LLRQTVEKRVQKSECTSLLRAQTVSESAPHGKREMQTGGKPLLQLRWHNPMEHGRPEIYRGKLDDALAAA